MTPLTPSQVRHLQKVLHWHKTEDAWVRWVDINKLIEKTGRADLQERPWCLDVDNLHKSDLDKEYDWWCFKVNLDLLLNEIASQFGTDKVGLLLQAEETG